MKKTLLSLALLAAMGFAHATDSIFTSPTINFSYQTQQNDNGKQGHIFNTQLLTKINDKLDADFTVNNFQSDVQQTIFIRTEVGLTPKYFINDWLRVSSRFSVGQIQTSNKGDWLTHTIEPKITATLPMGFETYVGYRYRAGAKQTDYDTSNTTSFGMNYQITKNDKIGFSIGRLTGDNGGTANNPNKTYGLNISHRF